jgi:hypothetical protein
VLEAPAGMGAVMSYARLCDYCGKKISGNQVAVANLDPIEIKFTDNAVRQRDLCSWDCMARFAIEKQAKVK